MKPILHLGNQNYSSWSMRPWLALTWGGVAFDAHVIPMGGEGYGKRQDPAIVAVSHSGNVPALQLGDVTIVDSLAICEWAAEQAPHLWPADALVRAQARAVTCEMHSGFADLRRALPCNIRRRAEARVLDPGALRDLAYLEALWSRCLDASVGPYLFGATPTIADAFFAPVATRLRTYAVPVSGRSQAYADTLLANAAFRVWEAAALAEPWSMPHWDQA
jgi:glutathione S-transferase